MKLKPFHPLSNSLIMSYLFNEGGGNKVYDATGRCNNGDGTNIAWGRDGLDLSGSNEHITIPNFIAQDDDWTVFISFTQDVRNPNSQSANTIFTAMTGTSGKSILFLDDKVTTTYKFGSYIDGSNNFANTVINTGKAHTIALTQSGTSFNFYLDGKNDGSFNATAISESGDIVLFDHKNAVGDGCLDGTVGVIHWFNRALTAEEMMWLDRDMYGMFEPDFIPHAFYAAPEDPPEPPPEDPDPPEDPPGPPPPNPPADNPGQSNTFRSFRHIVKPIMVTTVRRRLRRNTAMGVEFIV